MENVQNKVNLFQTYNSLGSNKHATVGIVRDFKLSSFMYVNNYLFNIIFNTHKLYYN